MPRNAATLLVGSAKRETCEYSVAVVGGRAHDWRINGVLLGFRREHLPGRVGDSACCEQGELVGGNALQLPGRVQLSGYLGGDWKNMRARP